MAAMKTNLTISKTVALTAIALTSLVMPTLAQAGGRSIIGPSSVVLDERGASAPVREPLPPTVISDDSKGTTKVGAGTTKIGDPNTRKIGKKEFVPAPLITNGRNN